MGAWEFVYPLIEEILELENFKNKKLYYAGRERTASTATGLYKRHIKEQEKLVIEAIGNEKL